MKDLLNKAKKRFNTKSENRMDKFFNSKIKDFINMSTFIDAKKFIELNNP